MLEYFSSSQAFVNVKSELGFEHPLDVANATLLCITKAILEIGVGHASSHI